MLGEACLLFVGGCAISLSFLFVVAGVEEERLNTDFGVEEGSSEFKWNVILNERSNFKAKMLFLEVWDLEVKERVNV